MRCTIDGVEYEEVPIDAKGEPAFLDDGGPNPDFDWDGWKAKRNGEEACLKS